MSAIGAPAVWVPAGSPTAHDVRLTRRGRLARTTAVTVILLMLALNGVNAIGTERALAADTAAPAPVTTVSVVVEQGDSLWAIAEAVAPQADPRDVIEAIRQLNGMRSNLIQPGQVLLIPTQL